MKLIIEGLTFLLLFTFILSYHPQVSAFELETFVEDQEAFQEQYIQEQQHRYEQSVIDHHNDRMNYYSERIHDQQDQLRYLIEEQINLENRIEGLEQRQH